MAPGIRFSDYQRTTPPWMGTPQTVGTKVLVPGGAVIDPTQFPYEDAVTLTVGAGGAAVDATTVPITATIPSGKTGLVLKAGTLLDFGGDKLVNLTADFNVDTDTQLTTRALVTALAENDTATHEGGTLRRKPIQSGTLVGRTYAERDAGVGYGPADPATDDQIALVAFPVINALEDNQIELYQPNAGNVVYEDRLPSFLTTADVAKIRELYQCIVFG